MRVLRLYIPGLLQTPGRSDPPPPRAPLLERLLSRARRTPGPGAGFTGDKDRGLFDLFGLPTPDAIPIAPLRYLGDTGQPPAGCVLAADPIHLHPDRSQLILFDARQFPLEQDEADTLLVSLQPLFSSADLQLVATSPKHWYLIGKHGPAIKTSPPDQVSGHDLLQFMPRGDDRRPWTTLLNETQMLLHQHPVNQAREDRGLPAVNSLWFWGGGTLPTPNGDAAVRYDRVLSEDPVTIGLATQQQQGPDIGPPAGLSAWIDQGAADDHCLLQLDTAHQAHIAGAPDAWADAITAVDQEWLPSIVAAIDDGRLTRVEIISANGLSYQVDRGRLKRFWRRTRPLSDFLGSQPDH